MSSEMIERVARAIATASGVAPDDDDGSPNWWMFRGPARAAIEAMREPTEQMQRAGYTLCVSSDNMDDIYHKMVDEALK